MKNWTILFILLGAAQLHAGTAMPSQHFIGDGEAFDLSLDVVGSTATLIITHKATNEALAKAQISYQSGTDESKNVAFKKSDTDGIYTAKPLDLAGGGHIIVQTSSEADAIELKEVAIPGTKPPLPTAALSVIDAKSFGLGVLLTLVVMVLIKVLRKRMGYASWLGGFLVAPLALSLLLGFSPPIWAHGGHDHGDAEAEPQSTDGAQIVMSKRSQLLIGLKTQRVQESEVADVLKAYGHIIPKPQLDAILTAPQPGFIRGVDKIYLGKKVKKGEILATLDAIQPIHLVSPINGEISETYATEGSRFDSGAKLFRITDPSVVWVDAEVFSADLRHLDSPPAEVSVVVEGTANFGARYLNQISPVSEETRTAKVFVELLPAEHLPKVGSFAEVLFARSDLKKGILVPQGAIVQKSGDKVVFVKTGPEAFAEKPVVTTEISKPGKVLITKGLHDQDLVVVEGSYQLLMKAR